jgi:hypothetical protein
MPAYDYRQDCDDLNFKDVEYYRNKCYYCHEENVIIVNVNDLTFWQSGEFIQDAFPYLNANQRELIKTGIHPECWDKMLGNENNE